MTTKLFPPIPSDTAQVVRPVFGRSNFYVAVGDQVNQLFRDLPLANPEQAGQKSTRSLAELHLITIFQYLETMPDNQAVEAVRLRRDWKYALHLPLNGIGYPASAFCEFRRELLSDPGWLDTLHALLGRLAEIEWSIKQESINTQADQIVTRVCLFSRLANTWEALVQAMEVLALRQPEWLRTIALPHWYVRYGYQHQPINYAGAATELEVLTQAIGADGTYLLNAISEFDDQALATLPEVSALKQVWQAQYECLEGITVWRGESCAGCIVSANQQNKIENNQNSNGGGDGMINLNTIYSDYQIN